LPSDTPVFAVLVFFTIILVGALCFFPVVAIGPIAEFLQH
jgi:K+-transporting ATPase ATPase A chain